MGFFSGKTFADEPVCEPAAVEAAFDEIEWNPGLESTAGETPAQIDVSYEAAAACESVDTSGLSDALVTADALPGDERVHGELPEIAGIAAELSEAEGTVENLPEAEGIVENLPEAEGIVENLPEAEGTAESLSEAEGTAESQPEAEGPAESQPEEERTEKSLPDAEEIGEGLPDKESAADSCITETEAEGNSESIPGDNLSVVRESLKNAETVLTENSEESIITGEPLSVTQGKGTSVPAGKGMVTCDMLLSNGVYRFSLGTDGGKVLEAAQNPASAEQDIRTGSDSGEKTQRFRLMYDWTARAYRISNEYSGLALQAGNADTEGTVSLEKSTGKTEQFWAVVRQDNGLIQIVSKLTGLALTLSEGNTGKLEQPMTGQDAVLSRQLWKTELTGSSVRLGDGLYEISLKDDSNLVAGTCGESVSEGASVTLQNRADKDSQKYIFVYCADGTYSINNYNSGKALSPVSAGNGANVIQKGGTGSAERWILSGSGNGSFYLVNAETGTVLETVSSQNSGAGSLRAGTEKHAPEQQFTIRKSSVKGASTGTFSFEIYKNTNYVMSIENGSKSAGAAVQSASKASAGVEAGKQNFRVTALGNGYYSIVNTDSGCLLAVPNNDQRDGAPVTQQKATAGNLHKMWLIHRENGGMVSFVNAGTGKMLMIPSASPAEGTGLVQKEFDNSAKRLFRVAQPQIGPVCDMLLPNGIYTIATAMNTESLLSVAGNSKSGGANIQLNKTTGSTGQRFLFTYDWGTRSYTITNENSGLVLNVDGGSTASGANVNQMAKNGSNQQRWAIRRNGDGTFMIVNQRSGRVLDVARASVADGSNITAYENRSAANQKWVIDLKGSSIRLKDGVYEIRFRDDPSLCAGVERSLMTNNANVQMQKRTNADKQKFLFTRFSDGTYQINNYNSGRALSAVSSSSGMNVVQRSDDSGNNQRWIICGAGNGSFYLVNASTGRTMGASSARPADGTNITAADARTGSQQYNIAGLSAPVSDKGTYILQSVSEKLQRITVSQGSRQVGASIELSSDRSGDANSQKFMLVPAGDGYYSIVNVKSKHVLAVKNGKGVNGQPLWQELASSSKDLNQRWLVHHNNNGSVSLINAKTGKTIMNSSGGKLIQTDYTSAASRQFTKTSTSGKDDTAIDTSVVPYVKYEQAWNRLNAVGHNLQNAYNWAVSLPYVEWTADGSQSTRFYANHGFAAKSGNCYVMAAVFCEMANALGYFAEQITGRVPLAAGGYGPHSWVEVIVDGTSYVCDPDFENETGGNSYLIHYGQSGTWRYIKDGTMRSGV